MLQIDLSHDQQCIITQVIEGKEGKAITIKKTFAFIIDDIRNSINNCKRENHVLGCKLQFFMLRRTYSMINSVLLLK